MLGEKLFKELRDVKSEFLKLFLLTPSRGRHVWWLCFGCTLRMSRAHAGGR